MEKTRIKWALDFFETLALLVVSFSGYIVFSYASQPLLDLHAFRQTQTALTAYWFIQEGFKWAYETPVAGAPWSIPFEFPLYQLIVAWFSQGFNIPLDFSGRIISYTFLLLCAIPARSITKNLNLPDSVFSFFVAILFSMPVYLYWGRGFMIETAALFFTIVTIKYFVDYLFVNKSLFVLLIFLLYSCLEILQKATTAIPVLVVLFFIFIASEIRRSINDGGRISKERILVAGLLFLIPVAVGFGWVLFTDSVKSLTPLGRGLTSAELSKWNWGVFSQRFSSDFWVAVVWQRIFSSNMAGFLGFILLLAPLVARVRVRDKIVVVVALVLGFFPLFLFTSLHIVHDYYQVGNVIFFAYGMAMALGLVVLPKLGRLVAMVTIILILAANYFSWMIGYFSRMEEVFSKENRHLAVGGILGRELKEDMQFVAFGNDWSSTFAYISKRKSFSVPEWLGSYDRVASNPEAFVEQGRLGAIVSCNFWRNERFDLLGWAGERSWRVGETHGCLIATPERKLGAEPWVPASCSGSIDKAEVGNHYGRPAILFAGWTSTAGENPEIPDEVFLKISGGEGAPVYLQTLKVPRLSVNRDIGMSDDIDAGFSRVLSASLMSGDYEVEILQVLGGRYTSCGIKTVVHVD